MFLFVAILIALFVIIGIIVYYDSSRNRISVFNCQFIVILIIVISLIIGINLHEYVITKNPQNFQVTKNYVRDINSKNLDNIRNIQASHEQEIEVLNREHKEYIDTFKKTLIDKGFAEIKTNELGEEQFVLHGE